VPTIALCMIVRNVEKTIGPCLESIAPYVDEIVIVDTGSTDKTKEIIRRFKPRRTTGPLILDFTPTTHPQGFFLDSADNYEPELGPFTNKPFLADFAAARNLGWKAAGCEYLLWVDADDIVVGGDKLASVLADMETGGYQTAFLNYDYNTNAEGQVTIQNWRERIFHRATNAAWVGRVHEVCIPPGPMKTYTEVNIVHKRREYNIQPEVANRNLKILFPWCKSQGEKVDPRILYYLATEERFLWPDRALADIKHYVQVSGSRDEIAHAHIYAGEIHERSDRLYEALAEYSLAAMWNPLNADAFFGAARVAYLRVRREQGNWDEVLTRTERGFEVTDTFTTLAKDPTTRASMPYVYYAIALVQTQQYEKGLKACDEGLKHFKPGSDEYGWLMGNRESCLTALNPNKVLVHLKRNEPLDAPSRDISQEVLRSMAIQIWKKIKESGDEKRADWFAQALPPEYTWQTEVGSSKPEQKTGLDIVIWTGPAWEKWSPKNLETGLGGSELAAIYMAREFVRSGCRVRVYSDCREDADIYDGVEYIHYDKSHVFETDVLIVSRGAAAIPVYGGKAKLKILWTHDVHAGMDPSAIDGVKAADLIFCLSHWHKNYFHSVYPFLNWDKVIVTRNGIDVARFAAEPKKIGNRLIFTSSPDRGLDRLLDLFPRIKDQVPDAELHVYYGFVTWEKMAELRNDQAARDQIAGFKRRMAETPGVVAHGRVGQKELAEAFLASKVLAYSTEFTETSCISAAEAQAAGCVPVTTALAALNETVKHGILIQPPYNDERYAKAFVGHVVGILRSEHERWTLASAGRAHGLTLGWNRVAAEWKTLFEKKLGRTAPEPTRIEVGKPKLVFVHEADDNWRDGLHAAVKLLENDFDVGWVNLAKGQPVPESAERLLAWGAFGSNAERACHQVKAGQKLLQVGGVAMPGNNAWDVVFAETDWHLQRLRTQITGPTRLLRAFGVNTDIYRPLFDAEGEELSKVYDWITVGALASWKRLERIARLSGSKLAVVQTQPNNRAESDPILAALLAGGVQVSSFVEPEKLAQLYNMSKACFIPADINGGGERAVLEARACGLPVQIESDNPKLAELRDGPVLDHHAFAASLKAGILGHAFAAVVKASILGREQAAPIEIRSQQEPKVSVLVMMSRPGGVDITFASLRDQTYKNFETIIVDSRYEKRHDAILKMAERYGLRDVVHVPEHRRNGKWIVACAAFNTAMALARGEIVIIMHDFMYAQPGWIESHVRAHEGSLKRHVVGNHANVDLPELSVTLPEAYETDRAIVESDPAFENLDELCIFKQGEFNPSWPITIGPRQWQPVFSSWFHAGRKPGKGWVTLTNDSFRREFLWDLGGINERFDHGRGPFDMEISSRVYAAGGEAVYIDQPCPPIFNPRFVMRSLPFGNHKQNIQDGGDERWTEADGVAHWHHVDAAGLKTAPNPFDMRELAARLAPWREPGAVCVPQDVSNVAYFRRKLRPTDP